MRLFEMLKHIDPVAAFSTSSVLCVCLCEMNKGEQCELQGSCEWGEGLGVLFI